MIELFARIWHLDEVFVRIGGRRTYLWSAVDDEGEVLGVLAQSRRNKRAALKLMRKLLKKQGYTPGEIVADKLGSYSAALRQLGLSHLHVTGGRLINRAEASHQPTRRRERRMGRFKSPGSIQRSLSAHDAIYNHQYRTVSWLMSMPRSCSRSSTFRSESGKRT